MFCVRSLLSSSLPQKLVKSRSQEIRSERSSKVATLSLSGQFFSRLLASMRSLRRKPPMKLALLGECLRWKSRSSCLQPLLGLKTPTRELKLHKKIITRWPNTSQPFCFKDPRSLRVISWWTAFVTQKVSATTRQWCYQCGTYCSWKPTSRAIQATNSAISLNTKCAFPREGSASTN